MKRISLTLIAFFCLCPILSYGVTLKQDSWNKPLVIQQSEKKALAFTSVAEILLTVTSNGQLRSKTTVGTGTLISNKAILTAAHINSAINKEFFKAYELGQINVEFELSIALQDAKGKKTHMAVKRTHINPSYNGGKNGVADVAILELKNPVDSNQFSISDLYEGSYEEILNKNLAGVGYGMYGGSDLGPIHSSNGKKRYYELVYHKYEELKALKEFVENGSYMESYNTLQSNHPNPQDFKTLVSYYKINPDACPYCQDKIVSAKMTPYSQSFLVDDTMSKYYGRSAWEDSGSAHFNEEGEIVSITSSSGCGLSNALNDSELECLSWDHDVAVGSAENRLWIEETLKNIHNNFYRSHTGQNWQELETIILDASDME